jgi:hypothetical protein
MRGSCECEGQRGKKIKRENEKYYLYKELRLFILGYTN